MGWFSKGKSSGGGGKYTDDQARADNKTVWETQGWGDDDRSTDGSAQAVEDRYRRRGIEDDYNGGRR
jgi:hypothetical protein